MLEHGIAPATGVTYEIENSLRFNDNDGAYLDWTPATDGNRKTWTFSTWVKRCEIGTGIDNRNMIFSVYGGSSSFMQFMFTDDKLNFYEWNGSADYGYETTALFRDVGAWYHIQLVQDTTQATASDRMKLYVNGEQVSFPQNYGDLPLNYDGANVNRGTYPHQLGRYQDQARYSDLYLAEVHFIDGQALDPSNFGETGDYGEWKPIEYTGTYGNNGFYLDFENSGSLGADVSGNGNNWTPTNLASTDQMLDSPTNNFCTLNAIDGAGSGTLSEGNLKIPSTNYIVRRGTFQIPKSGKWYWEWVAIGGSYGSYGAITSNVTDSSGSSLYGTGAGDDTSFFSAQYYDNYTDTAPVTSYGSYTSGDICQVAFDADTGTAKYYKNGTLQHTDSTIPTNVDLFPLAFNTCCSFSTGVWNFGQDSSFAGNKIAQGNTDGNGYGDFYYAPPTGYLALCTQNLPDPTVIPSEHFNTVLYTGNGGTNAITGVGFQPDWVWLKSRSNTYNHALHDSVRGVGFALFSNLNNGDSPNSRLDSFDTDGFTLNSSVYGNNNGSTFVAWNWKANGAGVSNTNGTITSTVSANVDAGFSIVNYTGSSSNATVGHGLSKAPELLIIKSRGSAENWLVYSAYTSSPATNKLYLDTTSGELSTNIWQNTAPTSSVFSLTSAGEINWSGSTYIAYAFHSVDGFSKVGSYTGNGSTDGTFVYTGFRPAFVMARRTDAQGNWVINDAERDIDNSVNGFLYPNLSNAEGIATGVDFTSNGFKLRSAYNDNNASGSNYIYIAFAEVPFSVGGGIAR